MNKITLQGTLSIETEKDGVRTSFTPKTASTTMFACWTRLSDLSGNIKGGAPICESTMIGFTEFDKSVVRLLAQKEENKRNTFGL